ncbi:Anthranilate phosphoribosyltransferase [hydrothermal vent metagenome]|uniref:anthranilate phosphoribosyltransferase n=1 Tax=hydrothermal vent metagenome TaxID=652676 RepID=A0A3B0TK55_9ZZZZ
MDIKPVLQKLSTGADLSTSDMGDAMDIIMNGQASGSQIGAFLMGLRVKGETSDEIAAAVAILRDKMVPVKAPEDAIDIVGTGGDGAGTYNISTATAIVVAAAGVAVAKHGNKALSSKSGSSEALQALGVKLDLGPEGISRCINKANIGFMFAPNHHPAMRYVGPTRAEMGTRTMFNLLGPQSNPAGVKRYLLGVYSREWVEVVAAALLANGAVSAWVVHGSDGLDEITTTGPTFVTAIENKSLRSFEISPQDAGLAISRPQDLTGGDPEHNARAIIALFDGEQGAYRDIVLINAAAALIIAGKAGDLKEGAEMAAQLIDSSKAAQTLARLVAISNEQQ